MDDVMWLLVISVEGPQGQAGFDFRGLADLAVSPIEPFPAQQTVASSFQASPERLDKPVPFGAI